MPIKFRCIHCRQLLGIAHTKAGEIVDCPTCGRSVRVPQENGAAQAVPPPEWNLKDRALRNALDALASIGEMPEEDSAESSAPSLPSAPGWDPAPAQMPESIPLNPLPSVDPVTLTAPPAYFAAAERLPPAAALAVPPVKPTGADELLTETANGSESSAPAAKPVSASTIPRSRWTPLVVGIAFLCAGFGAGVLVGRKDLARFSDPAEATSKAAPHLPATYELHGRVMYQTENGDVRAERGARVLVFPAERKGTARLPAAAFRPGDDPADFAIAAASLQATGGVLAAVGEDGTYSVELPGPGHYQIVMLSRFQPHDPDWTPDSPLRSLLEKYFERPDELLGRTACYFTSLRANDSHPVIADYLFPWPL